MRYLAARAVEYALIVWAVITISFFAMRFGGFDPVSALILQGLATPAQAQEFRESLGLDRPVVEQYIAYLGEVVQGHLGRSLYSGEQVSVLLTGGLRSTAPLAFLSWVLALGFGWFFGMAASRRKEADRTGRVGRWSSITLSAGAALPVALTGLAALWLAVPIQRVVPWSNARESISFLMAAIVLAVNIGFAIGRAVEAAMLQARKSPVHIAMLAQGYRPGWRMDWLLLRMHIAPLLSLAAMQAAFLLGGTMIVETIFSRPGLGRITVDAILRSDFPVIQAALAAIACGYALFGFMADGLGVLIDPRIQDAKLPEAKE